MNILEDKELRRRTSSVPEGYFESLQDRLSKIPEMQVDSRPGLWDKMKPAMALAASFVAALIIGGLILTKTAGPRIESVSYEQLASADLIPHTEPEIYFGY